MTVIKCKAVQRREKALLPKSSRKRPRGIRFGARPERQGGFGEMILTGHAISVLFVGSFSS